MSVSTDDEFKSPAAKAGTTPGDAVLTSIVTLFGREDRLSCSSALHSVSGAPVLQVARNGNAAPRASNHSSRS